MSWLRTGGAQELHNFSEGDAGVRRDLLAWKEHGFPEEIERALIGRSVDQIIRHLQNLTLLFQYVGAHPEDLTLSRLASKIKTKNPGSIGRILEGATTREPDTKQQLGRTLHNFEAALGACQTKHSQAATLLRGLTHPDYQHARNKLLSKGPTSKPKEATDGFGGRAPGNALLPRASVGTLATRSPIDSVPTQAFETPQEGWIVPPMLAGPLENPDGSSSRLGSDERALQLCELIASVDGPTNIQLLLNRSSNPETVVAQLARILELAEGDSAPPAAIRATAKMLITKPEGLLLSMNRTDGTVLARFLQAAMLHPNLHEVVTAASAESRGWRIIKGDLYIDDSQRRPVWVDQVQSAYTLFLPNEPLGRVDLPSVKVEIRNRGEVEFSEPQGEHYTRVVEDAQSSLFDQIAVDVPTLEQYAQRVTLAMAAGCSDASLRGHLGRLVAAGVLPTRLHEIEDPRQLAQTVRVWRRALQIAKDDPAVISLLQNLDEGMNATRSEFLWGRRLDPSTDAADLKAFIHEVRTNFPAFNQDQRSAPPIALFRRQFIGSGAQMRSLEHAVASQPPKDAWAGFPDPERAAELHSQIVSFPNLSDELPRQLHRRWILPLKQNLARLAQGLPPSLPSEGEEKSLALVGPPGVGKSTLLGWMAEFAIAIGLSSGPLRPEAPMDDPETRHTLHPRDVLSGEVDIQDVCDRKVVCAIDEVNDLLLGPPEKVEERVAAFTALTRRAMGSHGQNPILYAAINNAFEKLRMMEGGWARRVAQTIGLSQADDLGNFLIGMDSLRKYVAKQREHLPSFELYCPAELLFAVANSVSESRNIPGKGGGFQMKSAVMAAISNLALRQQELTVLHGKQVTLRELTSEDFFGPSSDYAPGLEEALEQIAYNMNLPEQEALSLGMHFRTELSRRQHNRGLADLDLFPKDRSRLGKDGLDVSDRDLRKLKSFWKENALPSRKHLTVYAKSHIHTLIEPIHAAAVHSGMVESNAVDVQKVKYLDGRILSRWQGETEQRVVEMARDADIIVIDATARSGNRKDGTDRDSMPDALALLADMIEKKQTNAMLVIAGPRPRVDALYAAHPKLKNVMSLEGKKITATGTDSIEDVKKMARDWLQRMWDHGIRYDHAGWGKAQERFGQPGVSNPTLPAQLIFHTLVEIYQNNGGRITEEEINRFMTQLFVTGLVKRDNGRGITEEDVRSIVNSLELPPEFSLSLLGTFWQRFANAFEKRAPLQNSMQKGVLASMERDARRKLVVLDKLIVTLEGIKREGDATTLGKITLADQSIFTDDVLKCLIGRYSRDVLSGYDGYALLEVAWEEYQKSVKNFQFRVGVDRRRPGETAADRAAEAAKKQAKKAGTPPIESGQSRRSLGA